MIRELKWAGPRAITHVLMRRGRGSFDTKRKGHTKTQP